MTKQNNKPTIDLEEVKRFAVEYWTAKPDIFGQGFKNVQDLAVKVVQRFLPEQTAVIYDEKRAAALDDFESFLKFAMYEMTDGRYATSVKGEDLEATTVETIRSLLQQKPLADVPEGWKLVPIEPTEEMLQEVDGALDEFYNAFHHPEDEEAATHGSGRAVYKAMLEAVPLSWTPEYIKMVEQESAPIIKLLIPETCSERGGDE